MTHLRNEPTLPRLVQPPLLSGLFLLTVLLTGFCTSLARRAATFTAPPPPAPALTVRDVATGIVTDLPAHAVPLSAEQARRLLANGPSLRDALLGKPVPPPGACWLLTNTLDERQKRVITTSAALHPPRVSDPHRIWQELERWLKARASHA